MAVFGIWRIKWARSPRYKAKGPSSRTISCRVCIKERYRDPSSRNRVRITSCGYAMHEAHVLETAAAPISPKKVTAVCWKREWCRKGMMAISQMLFQCFIYDKVYDGLWHSSIGGCDSTIKSMKALSTVHVHSTLEGITAQLPLHPGFQLHPGFHQPDGVGEWGRGNACTGCW